MIERTREHLDIFLKDPKNEWTILLNTMAGTNRKLRGWVKDAIVRYVIQKMRGNWPSSTSSILRQYVFDHVTRQLRKAQQTEQWKNKLARVADADLERAFARLLNVADEQPIPVALEKAFVTLAQEEKVHVPLLTLLIRINFDDIASSLPDTIGLKLSYTYLYDGGTALTGNRYSVLIDDYGRLVNALIRCDSNWKEVEPFVINLYRNGFSHLFAANLVRMLHRLESEGFALGRVIFEVEENQPASLSYNRAHLLNLPFELLCGPCELIQKNFRRSLDRGALPGIIKTLTDARTRDETERSFSGEEELRDICENCYLKSSTQPTTTLGPFLARNDLVFLRRLKRQQAVKTNSLSECLATEPKVIHIIVCDPSEPEEGPHVTHLDNELSIDQVQLLGERTRTLRSYAKDLFTSLVTFANHWDGLPQENSASRSFELTQPRTLFVAPPQYAASLVEFKARLADIPRVIEAFALKGPQKEALKNGTHILHFVSHGEFDQDGWKSDLKDGQLRASDLLQQINALKAMGMRIPVVCLQSCHSATCQLKPRSTESEMAISLSYLEKYRGLQAQGLMATLIDTGISSMIGFHGKIDAESSTSLLLYFYQEAIKWNFDIPLALQFARRRLQTDLEKQADLPWLAPVLLHQDFSIQ